MKFIYIACGLLALGSCVTNKALETRLAAERKISDGQIENLKTQIGSQQREIIVLKDSIRQFEIWQSQFDKHWMDIYEKALLVGDMKTATTALQVLITQDPDKYPWAYDSLAFYHYFHANPQELSRNTSTVSYMIDKGLSFNADNLYLLELKARILLIDQDDTGAVALFSSLFDKTGDYTYKWYTLYIEIMRGNVKSAETEVNKVISGTIATLKKVRLDHLPEHIRENVPVKAAFLYLRGMIQQLRGQYQPLANTLKESLKIYPQFYLAAKTLDELRQASQGMIR